MPDKVYGICGTNKCKREVVPMSSFVEDRERRQISTFLVKKSNFTANSDKSVYAYTVSGLFPSDEMLIVDYTCRALLHDMTNHTMSEIPLVGTLPRLGTVKDQVAMFYHTIYDKTVLTSVYITQALYNMLNDSKKKYLRLIFQRYE